MRYLIAIRLLAAIVLLGWYAAAPAYAQLDFHETFEGGSCIETWADGCPTTIVNAATMTGDHYLDKVSGNVNVETGLNATEMWSEIQFRINTLPTSNAFFWAFESSGESNRCTYLIESDGTLRMSNAGGSIAQPVVLSEDTNYTIEMRGKVGTGANAECSVQIDGGTVTTTSNGTWTSNIDIADLRRADSAGGDFFFDEIKRCAAGSIDGGACDPPAPSGLVPHIW